MNESDTTFAGEVQFCGWRDSHRSGPSITLALADSDALEAFRGLTTRKGSQAGHRFMIALVEIGDDEKPVVQPKPAEPRQVDPVKPKEAHPFGHQAAALIKAGFFSPSNLSVLESIGTDADYQEWCRHQPSAIDGNGDLDERTGELRCEPAHVRRAGEAGTAYKPPFATIPLTQAQHHLQHWKGELACLRHYQLTGPTLTPEAASDWFDRQRIKHVLAWAKSKLAKKFGVESIGDIEPEKLLAWAVKRDLQHFLPGVYR